MKVQFLNSSSIKTINLIKKTFAELMNEKKELNKITVTELAKKANITRSTFYTHYDNIYDVVNEYQSETIELLVSNDKVLNSIQDIYNYFDEIFDYLNENDEIYKMFLASDDAIYFLEKLKKLAGEKIYNALKMIKNDTYLKLDVNFFMDGIINELIKYFRNQSDFSLEDIHINSKKLFNKIFTI